MSMGKDRTAFNARLRLFTLALLVLFAWAGRSPSGMQPARSDGLTVQERHGKDIYFGLATTVKARIGSPPIEAPAMMLACANCHGSDARGKSEGGVVTPDITWEALTKPYGVTHPNGRTHPPYTERLLVRAVSLGIDPAGNPLHAAMPRFQMSHADINALTQYLKRLATDVPSGISDSEIRLGTVLPTSGPLAEAGRAAKAVLAAYFDALNAQGGVYGRRLELRVALIGGDGSDARAEVDRSLQDAAPFAMVGGLIAGIENDAIAVTEARGVPFVGPLTIFPELSGADSTTFYLLSGVEQQARALVDYSRTIANGAGTATGSPPAASVAIVHSAAAVPAQVVERIRDNGTQAGWHVTTVNLDRKHLTTREIADEVKRSTATHALLLIGGESIVEIATAMVAIDWTPALLVPGSLATNHLLRLPQPVMDRTLVALPSLPSDQTQAALEEYRKLAEAYHLSPSHMAWQLAALGSAKVLTHALKLAGRGLTRSTLLAALEDLSDFNTGLMPRLRFGRGRHIGAPGAYIVTLDPARKEFRQVTGWLRVN
jgi:ABC-type branched-subunit amino acid transport system substrate-binding protein